MPGVALAAKGRARRRPSDPEWPSRAAWQQLNDAVEGNLIAVDFPLSILEKDPHSDAARQLLENLKNPYYIGDQAGLTQTFGWLDAWSTKPSVYAVVARHAKDIAAAVNFARDNDLRLVVKGGGHSYQGTSNAPDSLLIWTRRLNDVTLHDAFVPQGCEHTLAPQPAVTVGAGIIGTQAYDAVTTKAGKYVQGGGCMTVGLAGLVQGGGFGSFSKRYGLAAGSLLEAEVITADGMVRIVNACTHPDLYWALKGGGGGTFGVVSTMTLRLHELPEFFGVASFTVKAASDDAYRRLLREFVSFYREHLFNHHWGEQARATPDNKLDVQMNSCGLSTAQAKAVWQPFLDWVAAAPEAYSLDGRVIVGSIPARHWWDPQWWDEHWPELVFPAEGNAFVRLLDDVLQRLMPDPAWKFDTRPGAAANDAWWAGSTGEVAWYVAGYESLWLPDSLLQSDAQSRLAEALYAASRHTELALHFNKGLAGAPPDTIAAARETAVNPAVLSAFALVIVAHGEGPAYPGIAGIEPSAASARQAAERIRQCMLPLRGLVPQAAAYVSESNYFESGWQRSYWGSNYPRLAAIKNRYDPDGLFVVHNGVGSEQWSADGFARV